MLYDPKWDQKIKADVFSLAGLIEWLEKQPATEGYCWVSTGECLVASYLRAATGEPNPSDRWMFSLVLGRGWPYGEVAEKMPHTYGAALERARRAFRTYGKSRSDENNDRDS